MTANRQASGDMKAPREPGCETLRCGGSRELEALRPIEDGASAVTRGRLPMRSWWSALVLVVLVASSAGLAQTRQGHALLQDTGLFKVPTSYTELAFTDPRSLPSKLRSKRAPINVSFAVHNVSGSLRTYQWSIVLVRSGRSHVKASGAVNVPAQGNVTVTRTVAMACVGGRLQVVVRLVSSAEYIDFWARCPSPIRSAR